MATDSFVVGVTGARRGATLQQRHALARVLLTHNATKLVHGGAKGADTQAHILAQVLEVDIAVYPGPDTDLGHLETPYAEAFRQPYLQRNRDIVDHCDILVAMPTTEHEVQRSGTWATVRYARKVGRRRAVVYPDGRVTE